MSGRTPQVGDVVTTAEELDALPIGTILAAVESEAPAGIDLVVRWSGSWRTDGVSWPIDPSAYFPLTVLYLPGHPPRPEREVAAEALREVAGSTEALERARVLIENELIEWRDSRRFTLRRNGLAIREKDGSGSEIIRFGFEYGYAMALRAEADRIARGDH